MNGYDDAANCGTTSSTRQRDSVSPSITATAAASAVAEFILWCIIIVNIQICGWPAPQYAHIEYRAAYYIKR